MRRRPPVAFLLAATLVLASCGDEAAPDAGDQGVRGTVTLGPTCPVETLDDPCADETLAGVRVRVFRNGVELHATATSGPGGRFELRLPPGTYTLEAVLQPGGPGMSTVPVRVDVPRGRFVDVVVPIDSGIRGPSEATG
jgi:hypothetical protein